ncbi:MAG: hypothetical protein ABW123_25435 [Cystobacter sp.]
MTLPSSRLLVLLALCACGAREEGTQVHLDLDFQPSRETRTEGTTREFRNAQGDLIRLRRAHVTLSSVELLPCQTISAWRWLSWLSPIGTAEAHSEGSPRKLGTPYVTSPGLADGERLRLGTLRPAPGSYCRAHLLFSPADADAEGLTARPDMEGKTLSLEGEWLPADGGPARPFHWETAGVMNAEVTLEGLTLSPDALEASRVVRLAYDRWLDGVDLTASDDATVEQILRNVAGAVTVPP